MGARPYVPPLPDENNGSQTQNGSGGAQVAPSVAVELHVSGDAQALASYVEAQGGEVGYVGSDYVEAQVPATALAGLAGRSELAGASERIPPKRTRGTRLSQGVATHLADAWKEAGITGSGIKVGVIDISSGDGARDGFKRLRQMMGSDLPSTVHGYCFKNWNKHTFDLADCDSSSGSGHGTGVAEIVMDVAPDAELYISNPSTSGGLRRATEWMHGKGVKVIVHSVMWGFDGPGDGTSPYTWSPLNTVKWAADRGILWVNATGNQARENWFGPFADADDDDLHEWSGTDEGQTFEIAHGSYFRAFIRWDDHWGNAANDLDLELHYIEDSGGNAVNEIVAKAENVQNGGSDFQVPRERLGYRIPFGKGGTYALFVRKSGGADPAWLQLAMWDVDDIEHYTAQSSVMNPAESNHPGMLGVNAAPYYSTSTIYSSGSRGPTADGRIKPDIVGAHCASSRYYGRFCGTSAAAPHVAGLAVLVLQQNPTFTPTQTANYLKGNAAPRGTPVPNNTWGYGFARLPGFSCSSAIVTNGDHTGAWTSSCKSLHDSAKSSRYYRFTLAQQATVTFDLTSAVDSYLYLRRGYNSQAGAALHEDDNGGPGTNARISATLEAGSYTLEATTASDGQVGSFTLTAAGLPALTPSVITISGGAAVDEGANATFTLTATPPPTGEVPVNVAITSVGGYAVATTQTVTMRGGVTSFKVATVDDRDDEADGSVTATITSGNGYTPGATAAATVDVRDNDSPKAAMRSIDTCSHVVTSDGRVPGEWKSSDRCYTGEHSRIGSYAQFYVFTLAKSSKMQIDLKSSVDTYLYVHRGNVRKGGVIAYNDDVGGGNRNSRISQTFNVGTYTIQATTYTQAQTGEFDLEISGLGAKPSPAVTIAGGADITEGADAVFTLTASPKPAADITVKVDITQLGEFATSTTQRSVTIGAGGTATLNVATTNDNLDEVNGWVTATVAAGTGYTVGSTSSANVNVDDDDVPAITITGGAGVTEGTDAVFTLSASPKPAGSLTVKVNVSQSGSYATSTAQRSVTVGTSGTATLNIPTTDDSLDEADGSVTGTVVAGTGYTVGSTSSASVNVADNDVPAISIAAGSGVTEGSAAVFTLTASPAPASSLSVTVNVSGGSDFGVTAGAKTVTVSTSGTGTLSVPTVDDGVEEAHGSVTATVAVGTGYTVASASSASVTVSDDDGSGSTTAACTTTATASDLISSVRAYHDHNKVRSDYSNNWFRVLIAFGEETSNTLTALTVAEAEAGELIWDGWTPVREELERLEQQAADCAALQTSAVPVVTVSGGSAVTEGGNASFTITASPKPTADITVNFSISSVGGYAHASTETVTITTSGTVTELVTTLGDSLDEPDGSVTVTITSGTGYTLGSTSSASVTVSDDDDPPPVCSVTATASDLVDLVRDYHDHNKTRSDYSNNWFRVLIAFGEETSNTLTAFTVAEAEAGELIWDGWKPVREELERLVAERTACATPSSTPVVTISGGSAVTEGGNAVFTLTASPKPSSSISVKVNITQSGSYAASTAQRTVSIGTSGSATLNVATTNDNLDEANGSVTATVASGTGYTVGSTKAATVAVNDNDPTPVSTPVVSISGGSAVTEGGNAVFTLSASPKPSSSISVKVNITQSGDYATSTSQRTVSIGTSGTATLSIATANDSLDEANGSVTATVATGTGYTLGATKEATVTVNDNDPTPPQTPVVSISGGSAVTEGGNALFTLSASPKPAGIISVKVNITQSGSYAASTAQRTVYITSTGTAILRIATTNDNLDEANGSVTATIAGGTGYTGSGSATVTVNDNDVPAVSIAGGSAVTEGSAAVFTLSASPKPASNISVKVNITQTGSYATSTSQRTVTIGTSGTATLNVATTGDDDDEPNGSVTATLAAGTGYTVTATKAATVTVNDDDDPPAVGNIKISIADASGPEGREAYPVVSLSEAAGVEVRVSWRTEFHPTAQNYALSTRDYWNGSGTLVFAPGETSKTIELYLAQDQQRENDEVFIVILSDPTGATIERSQATITITDDD